MASDPTRQPHDGRADHEDGGDFRMPVLGDELVHGPSPFVRRKEAGQNEERLASPIAVSYRPKPGFVSCRPGFPFRSSLPLPVAPRCESRMRSSFWPTRR